MLIYGLIIYLTIVGLFSIKRKLSKKIFYINCIIVFLIITLRGYDVGSIDTINYIDWCLGIKGSMYERGEERLEYLFVSYIHFLRTFVYSGTLFLMINATLSLFPLFYIVKKKSSNPHLSLMLFFMPLTIMHRFYFVCQRQILAVGVILLGIILFEKYKKNLHKYIIYILCAVIAFNLQRFSILLALAYIPLKNINLSKKQYLLMLFGSLLLGLGIGGFKDMSFLMNFYLLTGGSFAQLIHYSEAETFNGLANFMQPVTATLWGVGIVFFCNKESFNSIYSKMYLVGAVTLNILLSTVEVYRIAAMFTIFGLVIFPSMIMNMVRTTKYKPIMFAIILSSLYLYYSYFWTMYAIYNGDAPVATDSLVPYQFFWEDRYNY